MSEYELIQYISDFRTLSFPISGLFQFKTPSLGLILNSQVPKRSHRYGEKEH